MTQDATASLSRLPSACDFSFFASSTAHVFRGNHSKGPGTKPQVFCRFWQNVMKKMPHKLARRCVFSTNSRFNSESGVLTRKTCVSVLSRGTRTIRCKRRVHFQVAGNVDRSTAPPHHCVDFANVLVWPAQTFTFQSLDQTTQNPCRKLESQTEDWETLHLAPASGRPARGCKNERI